jgi:hypothetical protein
VSTAVFLVIMVTIYNMAFFGIDINVTNHMRLGDMVSIHVDNETTTAEFVAMVISAFGTNGIVMIGGHQVVPSSHELIVHQSYMDGGHAIFIPRSGEQMASVVTDKLGNSHRIRWNRDRTTFADFIHKVKMAFGKDGNVVYNGEVLHDDDALLSTLIKTYTYFDFIDRMPATIRVRYGKHGANVYNINVDLNATTFEQLARIVRKELGRGHIAIASSTPGVFYTLPKDSTVLANRDKDYNFGSQEFIFRYDIPSGGVKKRVRSGSAHSKRGRRASSRESPRKVKRSKTPKKKSVSKRG